MSVLSTWRRKVATRRGLLARARTRHRRRPTARTRAAVRLRLRQLRHALGVVRRHTPKLGETTTFDGTPAFRGLVLALEDARRNGWSGTLSSADRRRGVPERYGKLSQYLLYIRWLAGWAGYNPANPPGRSTHELRSDGVAYRGPVGRPLAWWQLGLDVTEADELRATLNRLGYQAFRPYSAGSEAHHVNLRSNPKATLRRRGLA